MMSQKYEDFCSLKTQMRENSEGSDFPSIGRKTRIGHRRRRQFGEDSCDRANGSKIISIRTGTDSQTNGGGSEEERRRLDL
jgi:hypothetical protein